MDYYTQQKLFKGTRGFGYMRIIQGHAYVFEQTKANMVGFVDPSVGCHILNMQWYYLIKLQ